MMSLQRLFQTDPISAYELTMKARDPNHEFFGGTGQKLMSLALVDANGGMHDSIRNIVLSAVEGDGLEMKLGSPIKKASDAASLEPVRKTLTSAKEHFQWCIDRAMEYAHAGDMQQAVASFMSDTTKHPEVKSLIQGNGRGMMSMLIVQDGADKGQAEFRKAMEGFNI